MQSKRSYNNAILNDKNTDPKTDSIVPYHYKQRREELNKLVKNHIATQQKKLIQKNKTIVK